MKCKKCGGGAVIELRRHNTAFCTPDFLTFFRNQVREAVSSVSSGAVWRVARTGSAASAASSPAACLQR